MKYAALLVGLACAIGLPLACSSTPSRPLGDDTVAITDHVQLANLTGPVDAVRDEYGMVHIYATNVPDAMRVMGYQMGRDRHVQLELIRRTAEGRMAEAFGDLSPSLIDSDISRMMFDRTSRKKMKTAMKPVTPPGTRPFR